MVNQDQVEKPMSEMQRIKCIKITKDLMELPCAKMFKVAVNPDEAPNYYQVIKNPVDLSLILKRLEDNEYATTKMWETDINFIAYNAEKYNGSDSEVFWLAQALQRQFKKRKWVIDCEGSAEWTEIFLQVSHKMEDVLANAPPKARKHFPTTAAKEANKKTFTENEYKSLETALHSLRTYCDQLFFNNVFSRYLHLDITNPPRMMDLRKMPVPALLDLQEFAHMRFEEMNKPYPDITVPVAAT